MEERNVIYDDEIDLYELVVKLWKYKTFIILFTIFCTVASLVAVNFITPRYKVTCQVVPNNDEFVKLFLREINKYNDPKLWLSDIRFNYYQEIIAPLFQSRNLLMRAIKDALPGDFDHAFWMEVLDEQLLDVKVERDKQLNNVITIGIEYTNAELVYKIAKNLLVKVEDELKTMYAINNSGKQLLIVTQTPTLPNKPCSPKKTLIIAVTFVTSLFFAVFMALIVDWIRTARKQYLREQ
ncbi:MAG TPA: Wzz/FepE/Etk N-terminal domain-containing protein [Spirochaetota bacterium]|nr:Wzz/FepE/Etk N-terminal domain-containing protein [Spirochaetota bacterium]HOM10452.1 Wzz/FepE/Etk N-terminal domain-containing protein [Spirochaetota bacterium]HPP50199.1 Wzz/FepE/Etk N-terminal domain-containing protein [Spirochaetota bacterium]